MERTPVLKLQRFWIEIEPCEQLSVRSRCFGVTAWTYEDALHLLQEWVLGDRPLSQIRSVVEDIDVSTLDEGHVRPNMGVVSRRGVWYPLGYESPRAAQEPKPSPSSGCAPWPWGSSASLGLRSLTQHVRLWLTRSWTATVIRASIFRRWRRC